MKAITILTLVLVYTSTFSYAQLLIENYSPYSTINPDFLGSNYQVSNVTFTGSLNSYGMFNGTNCNLGLDDGIVLTTGTVSNNGDGPQGPNNLNNAGVDNGFPGYSPLTNLIGYPTYNACVVEFDVVPGIDSIGFTYVFGSEEYPEYVGTNFSDCFAIFISGPGITGQQNMATLANGDAININTINSSANSSLFVENGSYLSAPYNNDSSYIQYDGFTVPLTASKTGLQIGQTYHITFAITDVGDGIFDSGLFIRKCTDCGFQLGISEIHHKDKQIIGIFDPMGRVIKSQTNTVMIYLYDDGTSERVYISE